MPRLHAKQTKLSHIDSGSFRPWPGGGAQTPTFAPALPSFVATHDFFAKITQNLISLCYQIVEKWANLRLPLNVQNQKCFRGRGALRHCPPDQELCPWTPLGALPLDPRYRLALAMGRCPQILWARTATAHRIQFFILIAIFWVLMSS